MQPKHDRKAQKSGRKAAMPAKVAKKADEKLAAKQVKAAMARVKVPPAEEVSKFGFWADQIADEIAARIKAAGKPEAVVKAGASPSGAKHIGNLFDVMKAYIVYKALKKKGIPARFVLTHDDRDPLRTMPAKLPTLEGKLVDTAPFRENFVKYVGHPYHTIPDPFDCCHSWAEHFSKVWEDGIMGCGISEKEIEFVSNNSLYTHGKFEPFVATVLKDIKKVRQVFAPFQKSMKLDYVPLTAICQNCGKITARVVDWDMQNKTLTYSCEAKLIAAKYAITGCGHKAVVPWDKAKLAWRFEWPAQWGIFGVDFEAFGKDHAEGSWPSGQVVAREIYKINPPIPHIYEFLLVNGEKMSARRGNVYIAQDMLDIIEPEIFVYFYTKRSKKQRNLDIRNIYLLVDDFERVERIYWGVEKEPNEHDRLNAIREYESAMAVMPKRMPLRIEYQFAAMVSQLAPDTEHAIKMLRASGHIKPDQHLTPDDIAQVAHRLTLARKWVHKYAPEFAIKINDTVPKEIVSMLTAKQRAALRDLAALLEQRIDQQSLYNAFYEIAKKHDLPPKEFFNAAYRVLIGANSGPRLAPFIMALTPSRVKAILEQIPA
ncbi:MAG: lysine--tRNA ligase [Candidatus Aenigmatarchaeota archaeon]